MRKWVADFFTPAPDSLAACSIRKGKSPWVDAVHLLWSVWVFVTPLFDHFTWRWAAITALSYPLFLVLYAKCFLDDRRSVWIYALMLVVLAMALLPWYPSGLSYFIYGCVMLSACRFTLRRYMLVLSALNLACLAEAWLLHYPWQAVISLPIMSFIIGLIIYAERTNERKDAELQLSHDEVRRLAATAERERIGRDLHDLLGHTLSLITLKLELSRKLFERDTAAAKREMAEAERVARHALAEVRSAVSGIRATDIAAELASSRLLLESSGVRLDYDAPPIGLPSEVERALALVLREAATNITRHARAGRASIVFTREARTLVLRIEDNGRGGISDNGNGLNGMRERVGALQGTLSMDSPKGQGTRLLIRVPLPALSLLSSADAPQPDADPERRAASGRPAA